MQQLRPRSLNPFLLCASLDIYHPLIFFYSHLTPADDFLSAPRSQALISEAFSHVRVFLGHFLIFTFDHGLCFPSHTADGRVEECLLIFSHENSKIATNCWTTIHRRMLDPTKKKKIPHIQEKRRSHNKTIGGVKSCLKSNHIHAREARRAQAKPCAHQDPGERLSDLIKD